MEIGFTKPEELGVPSKITRYEFSVYHSQANPSFNLLDEDSKYLVENEINTDMFQGTSFASATWSTGPIEPGTYRVAARAHNATGRGPWGYWGSDVTVTPPPVTTEPPTVTPVTSIPPVTLPPVTTIPPGETGIYAGVFDWKSEFAARSGFCGDFIEPESGAANLYECISQCKDAAQSVTGGSCHSLQVVSEQEGDAYGITELEPIQECRYKIQTPHNGDLSPVFFSPIHIEEPPSVARCFMTLNDSSLIL